MKQITRLSYTCMLAYILAKLLHGKAKRCLAICIVSMRNCKLSSKVYSIVHGTIGNMGGGI